MICRDTPIINNVFISKTSDVPPPIPHTKSCSSSATSPQPPSLQNKPLHAYSSLRKSPYSTHQTHQKPLGEEDLGDSNERHSIRLEVLDGSSLFPLSSSGRLERRVERLRRDDTRVSSGVGRRDGGRIRVETLGLRFGLRVGGRGV